MNTWTSRFNKARKTADYIEKGITPENGTPQASNAPPSPIKHYTLYSIVGTKETPIAWRLYAADVDRITAAAQRRMLRAYESIVEGDPMYVCTRYEAREEICQI